MIIFFLFSFLDIDSIPEVKGTDIIETKTQNVNILHPIGYPCQNGTTPGFQSFTIMIPSPFSPGVLVLADDAIY